MTSISDHASVEIEGIRFIRATVPELSRLIKNEIECGVGGWVVTPNVDITTRIRNDESFAQLTASADVFTADGTPIVWASKILGKPLPGRLTGSDLFVDLFKLAIRERISVALIGGNEGAATAAARKLVEHESQLDCVHCFCPPFGFEKRQADISQIDEFISAAKPKIVFVGLGSPKQEIFISRFRARAPDAWWLGVGISFSFVAGDVKRAPQMWQKLGLEWFFRLVQEPKRLAKRYLIVGLPAAAGILIRAAFSRIGGRSLR